MKRFLKYSGITIFIVVVILTSMVVLGFYMKNKIAKYALGELNKSIHTEISVSDISITFLSKFPNVAIEFTDITALSTKKINKKHFHSFNADTLFSFHKLFVEFNIWDVFKGRYDIKKIDVYKGNLSLLFDLNGNNNYQFWETNNDSKAVFNVDLKSIRLRKVSFNYINAQSRIYIESDIDKLLLSGNLSDTKFDMKVALNGAMNTFVIDQVKYLNFPALIEANTVLSIAGDQLTVNDASVDVSGISLLVNGDFNYGNKKSINISLASKGINIDQLLKMIPEKYQSEIIGYKTDGELYLNASITGDITPQQNPKITAKFGVIKGNVQQRGAEHKIENISLTGFFSNGAQRSQKTSAVVLKDFAFTVQQSSFSGNAKIYNFESPLVEGSASFKIFLNDFEKLSQEPILTNTSGLIEGDVSFQLKTENKHLSFANLSENNGKVALRDIAFTYNKQKFENISGNIQLTNNDLMVDTFKVSVASGDYVFNVNAPRFFNFLLNKANPLVVNAFSISNNVDLNQLLAIIPADENKTDTASATPLNYKIHLIHSSKKFKWNDILVDNLSAIIDVSPQQVLITKCMGRSFGGGFVVNQLDYQMNLKTNQIATDIELQGIEISKIFVAFDDFGQKTLTSDKIKGKLSGSLFFRALIENEKLITPSILCDADIKILNGELINFEPLNELSAFVDIKELKHIKFSTITNRITIEKEVITIPKMEIRSNAINLTASGVHRFDNTYEYHVQVLLSDIIWKKSKSTRKKYFDHYEVEDDGVKTMLPIVIINNGKTTTVSWDKKEVAAKIKTSLTDQKKDLKRIFKEEFSFKKNVDTPTQEVKKIKHKIVWDDDDNASPTNNIEPKNTPPPANLDAPADNKTNDKKFTIKWEDE